VPRPYRPNQNKRCARHGLGEKMETKKNIDYYLQIYDQVHETHRYEGNGIWSRFNIMISLNMILFGLLTFLKNQKMFIIIICVVGILLCLWAIYVLYKLWTWHVHWCNTLKEIECLFPEKFPKPFSKIPDKLKKSNIFRGKPLFFAYTQPFLFIFCLLWAFLLIFTIKGTLLKDNQSEETKKIEIIKMPNQSH